MNTDSYAKECGLRCRRIRQARNMSQQELADLMFTTPQNISKYEKEGISSIDTIKRISEVLGQDLLTDERDVEGTVGELGKEILFLILCNEGKKNFHEIVNFSMYGLSEKDVTNEIFKLERIGLCVREQYKDWDDEEADNVFITAKGIITLKNLQNNEDQTEEIIDALSIVKSYEELTGEWGSMQEYIENNPVEKMIRSISYEDVDPMNDEENTLFRINYVKYLKEQYTHSTKDFLSCFQVGPMPMELFEEVLEWIPSKGIYHDILYRMACELDDANVEDFFSCTWANDMRWYTIRECSKALFGEDDVKRNARVEFIREFDDENDDIVSAIINDRYLEKKINSEWERLCSQLGVTEAVIRNWYDKERGIEHSAELANDENLKKIEGQPNEVIERIKALCELSEARDEEIDVLEARESVYERNRPEGAFSAPIDWYSKEEIELFIRENYLPPQNEWESELDRKLKEINRLDPDTLDYYTFPEEWEDNGLADLVRERCGIEKPSTESPE